MAISCNTCQLCYLCTTDTTTHSQCFTQEENYSVTTSGANAIFFPEDSSSHRCRSEKHGLDAAYHSKGNYSQIQQIQRQAHCLIFLTTSHRFQLSHVASWLNFYFTIHDDIKQALENIQEVSMSSFNIPNWAENVRIYILHDSPVLDPLRGREVSVCLNLRWFQTWWYGWVCNVPCVYRGKSMANRCSVRQLCRRWRKNLHPAERVKQDQRNGNWSNK